jgi:hypothetical protein
MTRMVFLLGRTWKLWWQGTVLSTSRPWPWPRHPRRFTTHVPQCTQRFPCTVTHKVLPAPISWLYLLILREVTVLTHDLHTSLILPSRTPSFLSLYFRSSSPSSPFHFTVSFLILRLLDPLFYFHRPLELFLCLLVQLLLCCYLS